MQLGFYPLLKAGVIDAGGLIADCKSGVSGAGRKAEIGILFSEAATTSRPTAWPATATCRKLRRSCSVHGDKVA
jgi:N-acetyl-gamma-glutamylphosphate reductase